ncbi:MAG: sulfatase-like hydrolase/transferase [candidate division Zixibacteria bacterium]|nr:sulfatase-like hydrolase/transferase [candidate division Zixibacteria bacterium]
MKAFRRLPRRIRFGLVVIGLNVLLLTLFRVVFWLVFRSAAPEPSSSDFIWALYLGFRFDLRLSLLIFLPVLALSWIPGLNFVRSRIAKSIWLIYFVAIAAFLILTCFVDLAHYDYLHDRLNARAVEHILSPLIALEFIWETYRVIPGISLLVLLAMGYGWLVKRVAYRELEDGGHPLGKWPKLATVGMALILYGLGIHGKLSQYPLRWSEAYFSTNPFVTALALNPVLFFFDTREYKTVPFDEEKVRDHYDLVADLLEVDNPDRPSLNFSRYVVPKEKLAGRPNVVLILLESFAGFKVGAFGNGLNPTPYFDSIARNSLLFNNFFVTRPPTARAVFTAMFGIPDIHAPHSASRNPLIVRQHTIVNALKGYKKMYLLGGSANWGNIRGVLAHNIEGLEIYEEGDFSYLPDDAWGISDLHLFEEANRILRVQDKPFFALIHTAGNHRPYTIPKDKRDFEEVEVDEEKLKENGFDSLRAYNGIRFLDYSLGHFFSLASKEDYFKRTIFCMYADHGTIATRQIPWDELTLTSHHIPFAIYAPGYFTEGRTIDTAGSLVDVLPTVLGLIGTPYLNKTLGRDLLVERSKDKHFAFINNMYRGLLDDEFLMLTDPQGRQRLYRYRSDSPLEDVREQYPQRAAEMARLEGAIRETSKYLLFHNAPANHPTSSQ